MAWKPSNLLTLLIANGGVDRCRFQHRAFGAVARHFEHGFADPDRRVDEFRKQRSQQRQQRCREHIESAARRRLGAFAVQGLDDPRTKCISHQRQFSRGKFRPASDAGPHAAPSIVGSGGGNINEGHLGIQTRQRRGCGDSQIVGEACLWTLHRCAPIRHPITPGELGAFGFSVGVTALALIVSACARPLPTSAGQEAVISPQAADFIKKSTYTKVPSFIPITAKQIIEGRDKFQASESTVEDALISKFALTTERVLVNNVPVLVISPAHVTPGLEDAIVQNWFNENGVEYVRTYPRALIGEAPDDLFTAAGDTWSPEAWLAQLGWMRSLGHEGGLFVTVGRREAA
jgi:hypothetical protein